MNNENSVAKILKVYGIVNGIASLVLAIILHHNLPRAFDSLWIVEFGAGLVASFLIYAFGEVIQLLQDIKYNTLHKPVPENHDELPDI